MTEYTLDDRWQENRATWANYWKSFTIERFGATLAFLALIVAIAGYINQHGLLVNLTNILGDFYANVSSELISIVITVLVLDRLNARRQNVQELARLKALMGSNEVTVTKIAIAELRAKGWISDGSLKDANLFGANLSGADLMRANLTNVVLWHSNLSNADLYDANLSRAKCRSANLSGANCENANLSGADFNTDATDENNAVTNLSGSKLALANLSKVQMSEANLSNADLSRANLSAADMGFVNLTGANLMQANLFNANLDSANLEGAILFDSKLQHANVYGVQCNTNTILPDGKAWSKGVDWSEYGAVVIADLDKWQAYRKEHRLDTN